MQLMIYFALGILHLGLGESILLVGGLVTSKQQAGNNTIWSDLTIGPSIRNLSCKHVTTL